MDVADVNIDIKIKMNPDGIPKLVKEVLMKGPGKFELSELIMAANRSGLNVTIVIDQPGGKCISRLEN